MERYIYSESLIEEKGRFSDLAEDLLERALKKVKGEDKEAFKKGFINGYKACEGPKSKDLLF